MNATGNFRCESRVGRLVEARVFSLPQREDATAYSAALARVLGTMSTPPDRGPILLADHRPVMIYSPAVADELAALFSAMNRRLSFVAILVARSNATLVMQLERIVREAQNPARRVFHEPAGALTFLRPQLDGPELARATQFLGETT